jgi:DNA-binding FadR family transcriptional regulator
MESQTAYERFAAIQDRQNLGGDVAHLLRARIFSGELAPGQRLPSEKELAAQIGVSHPTVRVALRTLRESGLITTARGVGGGSSVSSAEKLDECWVEWALRNRETVEHILEFQMILETHIAQLAAERRTEEDLQVMRDAIQREHKGFLPTSQLGPATDFHYALAAAAHNQRLAHVSNQTRRQVFLPLWRPPSSEWWVDSVENHEGIFQAVWAQDPQRAAEQLRLHLMKAQDFIRDCIEQSLRELTGQAVAISR